MPYEELIQFEVLIELIRNAANAMVKYIEGTIALRIGKYENIGGSKWMVMIKDYGPGIPRENLNKIFQLGFTTSKLNWVGFLYARLLCLSSQ